MPYNKIHLGNNKFLITEKPGFEEEALVEVVSGRKADLIFNALVQAEEQAFNRVSAKEAAQYYTILTHDQKTTLFRNVRHDQIKAFVDRADTMVSSNQRPLVVIPQ